MIAPARPEPYNSLPWVTGNEEEEEEEVLGRLEVRTSSPEPAVHPYNSDDSSSSSIPYALQDRY